MPHDDPDPNDPSMLVGVVLPADENATREMAVAFAEEFAQLGFSREQILALYRSRMYAGAHAAHQALGEMEIARIVDESLAVWQRYRWVVTDTEELHLRVGRAEAPPHTSQPWGSPLGLPNSQTEG